VNIQSNGALTTLDGLTNLVTIGGNLQLYGNGSLTSIQGLIKPTGKLNSVGSTLTIQINQQLTVCQADALKAQVNPTTYNQSTNLACTTPKVCTAAHLCQ
jgi:hypothetical protein